MNDCVVRVRVDVQNPGQFLACCGLLELAGRVHPGSEGWFDEGWFVLRGAGSLRPLLQVLADAQVEVEPLAAAGVEVKPLIAPLSLVLPGVQGPRLLLDAWVNVVVAKGEVTATGNPPWNFWSGQQTSERIWRPLQEAFKRQLETLADEQLPQLLQLRVGLRGRFGFDPGAAWSALDAGFSPDAQEMKVAASAATELLAAVGVERHRPAFDRGSGTIAYAVWRTPLGPVVAAAASVAALAAAPHDRFVAKVVARGQYEALARATRNPMPGVS